MRKTCWKLRRSKSLVSWVKQLAKMQMQTLIDSTPGQPRALMEMRIEIHVVFMPVSMLKALSLKVGCSAWPPSPVVLKFYQISLEAKWRKMLSLHLCTSLCDLAPLTVALECLQIADFFYRIWSRSLVRVLVWYIVRSGFPLCQIEAGMCRLSQLEIQVWSEFVGGGSPLCNVPSVVLSQWGNR